MIHRRLNNLAVLFFLLAFKSFTSAQIIESINIEGYRKFSSSDYSNWISVKEGEKFYPWITDTIKNRISKNLSDNGYYNFIFEHDSVLCPSDSQNIKILLSIKEGEPTFINKIYFDSLSPADSAEIKNSFDFLEGTVFIKDELLSSIGTSLNYFENSGFPFTKIIIESVPFFYDSTGYQNFADIFLKIDRGRPSRIDSIAVVGNTKTKDYVILRELRLTVGEEYSQERIEEIPSQLNRMRFFEPAEQPVFYFDPANKGVLQITVKEKETNNFDGIIGYVPGKNSEKGYLTGYLKVSLRNIFGTGRSAAFSWQQENQYSQELEIKYLEPWIFGYPFSLNFGLFQRKQDTTYVQRSLEGTLEYLATQSISASLLISNESTIPAESAQEVFSVFQSSSLTTGINLKIDTRNDFYSPTGGIFFFNTYKYASKKIDGPDKFITPSTKTRITIQKIEIDFGAYYQLFARHVAALTIYVREMKGDYFENSDLYKLGGANSLRGYREKQFSGNRIFWSNLEYRYLVSRRSFLFAFFDTGYFLRNEDKLQGIEKLSDFLTGYGLGINIETALGVMTVSYALGKGDSISDGKLHFGLLNEF